MNGQTSERQPFATTARRGHAWSTNHIGRALVDAAAMAGLLLLAAATIHWLGDGPLQRVATHAAIMIVAVVSLQVFSGNTGILSFGHAAVMALAAYVVGILTLNATLQATALPELPSFVSGRELNLGTAMLVATVAVSAAGILFGAVMRRLSGVGASIATLALLIIVYTILVGSRDFTRGSQPFYGVPRGVGLWIATVAAVLTLSASRIFRESIWGLTARAVAEDVQGAAAAGVDARRTRFAAWIVSVAGAAVAGGLLAQFLGAFSPHTFYFDLTFLMLAMLIVGGIRSTWGALSGVVAVTALIEVARHLEGGGELLGITVPSVFGLTQGVLAVAMLFAIWRRPEGLVNGSELRIVHRLGLHSRRVGVGTVAEPGSAAGNMLEIESLTKRYDGLVAVNDVSVTLQPDAITGIIGPNGAGKTTLIDLISGHAAPTNGWIGIGSCALTGLRPDEIAAAGIARTFQQCRIFPRMTVFENVLVAARMAESRGRGKASAVAWRELAAAGLADHADLDAGHLAPGLQRYLEIARALAPDPAFLLLDEPAAGLNTVETERLRDLIVTLQKMRRIGIVLIEHDMSLVMSVSRRILVLDRGRVIADGTPAEIQADERVIGAYLGPKYQSGLQDAGAKLKSKKEQV